MFLFKLSSVGIFCCLVGFASLNTRMLGMLISLEAFMLMLLGFFYSSLTMSGVELHYFLVLLVFAVCEAALALSLLVSVLRLRGNDYISSFSSLNFYV